MHGTPPSPDIKSADIGQNVHEVQRRIARAAKKAGRSPADLTVIGVTQTVDPFLIQQAFQAGIRHFGESRIQEAKDKIAQRSVLQPRPTWHRVGKLQTNKVKTAIEPFDFIPSVDSIRLAEAISEHAQQAIPILIQVNVSGEASKYGFPPNKVRSTIEQASHLPHLEIKGLMTIAPYTDNTEDIRPIFRQVRMLRDSLGLEHLSMGMTDDFEVAIEEGATMVRIGRAIFGERED